LALARNPLKGRCTVFFLHRPGERLLLFPPSPPRRTRAGLFPEAVSFRGPFPFCKRGRFLPRGAFFFPPPGILVFFLSPPFPHRGPPFRYFFFFLGCFIFGIGWNLLPPPFLRKGEVRFPPPKTRLFLSFSIRVLPRGPLSGLSLFFFFFFFFFPLYSFGIPSPAEMDLVFFLLAGVRQMHVFLPPSKIGTFPSFSVNEFFFFPPLLRFGCGEMVTGHLFSFFFYSESRACAPGPPVPR